MQNGQLLQVHRQALGQQDNDREDHGGGPDYGRPDQHRLGSRLETYCQPRRSPRGSLWPAQSSPGKPNFD